MQINVYVKEKKEKKKPKAFQLNKYKATEYSNMGRQKVQSETFLSDNRKDKSHKALCQDSQARPLK